MNAHFGLQGWFTVELRRRGKVLRHLEFPNTIVDNGLDAIGSNAIRNLIQWCAVGTGGTPPTTGDAGLQAELTGYRTQANNGTADAFGWDAANHFAYFRRTRIFTESQANGNLAEVGFFSASTFGTMFTRQLMRDPLGDPTVIVKTSDDQLLVVYEVRMYPNMSDVTGTVTLNGVDYAWTMRPCGAAGSPWGNPDGIITALTTFQADRPYVKETFALVDPTLTPPLSFDQMGDVAWQTYGAGTYYRDIIYTWEPNVANFATGIEAVFPFASNGPAFQCRFVPKIPKTSVHRLRLRFRISWARHA